LLFDEALAALEDFGTPGVPTGLRLMRFELIFLRELGYSPALRECVACGGPVVPGDGTAGNPRVAFSSAAGGVLCAGCTPGHRDALALSTEAWEALVALHESDDGWHRPWGTEARAEVRQMLNHYVTHLRGRRPRLLPYLGS
jgi:recombinational DNA repair protein (RecF pathway)